MRRARTVAAAILALGLGASAAVYVHAGAPAPAEDPEAEAEAYDATHSRSYERQVEQIGGKAAAFAIEMNERVASAFRGRALAYTLAVASVALAAAWLLASRLASATGSDGEPGSADDAHHRR
jgi:hypothetical protein